MPASAAARFAAAYAALNASHTVGDHIVQLDHDAVRKGLPGTEGRAACARHVATYTATQALTLAGVNHTLRLGLTPRGIAAALALSAATHYAIDRSGGRWAEDPDTQPTTALVRTAHRLGKGQWLQRDPQAGYRYDQALHKGILLVASLAASTRS
ncbi:hypothetical protein F0L17_14225 [Streptomyces sp. TRM43335]|uniref:DUF3307 domain-containing protein n=1 Tax=Streptomyces taklimakanensis TaxID=2569853 RepID=A0A6G2BDF6_9ACTN|nr:hypothetical protein [Streptomyces taklimakanensis]MTE20244.1 hypothetical protein [Streptomyces taklimakanensis]